MLRLIFSKVHAFVFCFAGCAISGENQIFLAGGAIRKINYRGSITTEGVSNNFYIYDQTTANWQMKAKMHMSRAMFCLTIVDGYVQAPR